MVAMVSFIQGITKKNRLGPNLIRINRGGLINELELSAQEILGHFEAAEMVRGSANVGFVVIRALLDQLEVEFDERGNIKRDNEFQTNIEGVFVAGDAGRGQSLIVWAIAEGRSVASAVDKYLVGETQLPAPIEPTARPLMV